MNDYYFFYKTQQGHWNSATNPVFIAKHQWCRAVPKNVVDKSYDRVSDFMYELNCSVTSEKLSIIKQNYDLF